MREPLARPTFGVDGVDLGLAALIAPDERGPDDLIGIIEHDQAVHLAGEADALDLTRVDACVGEYFSDGEARGTPPVVGILLRPEGMPHGNVRMGFGATGADDAVLLPRAARACCRCRYRCPATLVRRARERTGDVRQIRGAVEPGFVAEHGLLHARVGGAESV